MYNNVTGINCSWVIVSITQAPLKLDRKVPAGEAGYDGHHQADSQQGRHQVGQHTLPLMAVPVYSTGKSAHAASFGCTCATYSRRRIKTE